MRQCDEHQLDWLCSGLYSYYMKMKHGGVTTNDKMSEYDVILYNKIKTQRAKGLSHQQQVEG